MASSAAPASTHASLLQAAGSVRTALERWLEAERDQLVLWLPVLLGAGIAAWFVLPAPWAWRGAALGGLAAACAALAVGHGGRTGRAVAVGGVAFAIGVALVWWRAERVAAPVLARPAFVTLTGRVERVQPLPARELVRLRLAPLSAIDRQGGSVTLPPSVRVNVATADLPTGVAPGSVVAMGARLMAPASSAVPGAYDFARVAWFDGLGATGRAFAPITIVEGGASSSGLRTRLAGHIQAQLPGSAGGIAAALATGDTGAIAEADNEAMRRAGLSHLLSVSGLHITAVVGLVMWATLRLLALSPWLALKVRLPLVAGATAALAAIGYTLLTGAEVPTIRSCVAALLVLAALALGREAVTLRLVAAGALVVLLLWPESLVGPSFQLSFAAVTAIVALHEHPWLRERFDRRDDGWWRRVMRGGASLLLTGLAVELALMPIAVFHFHKAGLYGAVANIVAIPLTTFVIMPLEALALLADVVGLGWPLWWLTGKALAGLLWLAHAVASAPGAVAALPAMPRGAFGLCVAGGLWLALWRTPVRRWGLVPLAIGAGWAIATPAPDLLVTGDGRHVAVRTGDGSLALLRDRAGDYVRGMLAENGGVDGEPLLLSERPEARCSADLCLAQVGGKRVLATRSSYPVPIAELVAACAAADVVVSERRLPRTCRPKWLKLDRPALARSGGVAISFASGRIDTVRQPMDAHPWVVAARKFTKVTLRDELARSRSPARGTTDQGASRRDRSSVHAVYTR